MEFSAASYFQKKLYNTSLQNVFVGRLAVDYLVLSICLHPSLLKFSFVALFDNLKRLQVAF